MLIANEENGSPFHKTVRCAQRQIPTRVTPRWIQHFMACNRIVLRAQTGKLMMSSQKQIFIEKYVSFHLGQLKRGFESGKLAENERENADGTHFIFNMDNGKTKGFIGD